MKEADGTTRVVKYKSGPHTGFEAVVERIGHAGHPEHYGHGHVAGGYGGHGDGGDAGGHGGYGAGGHGYAGNGGHGAASSWVGPIHWSNQGHDGHHGY